MNNGCFIGLWLKVSEQDRIAVPVPLYHCFGFVIGTMAAVEAERCMLVYGVPTMFIAQLNHPEFARFDFSSLRGGIMAGAPCPVEIMKRVMVEMHCPEIKCASPRSALRSPAPR